MIFAVDNGNLTIVLIFAALAAIMLLGWLVTSHLDRKRSEALSEAASGLGLAFQPGESHPPVLHAGAFRLFGRGRGTKALNLMEGRHDGQGIAAFDYHYTTGHGKQRHIHRQSVVAVELGPESRIASFSMRPETTLHRIGRAFGVQDIDFDSHPEFSRKYLLQGEDEYAVRDLFTTSVLDYFEPRPGLSVEHRGGWLIVYRDRHRDRPEDISTSLDRAAEIARLLAGAATRRA